MESIKKRLISDKNIFLSIYLVYSYIQNRELLTTTDEKKLDALRDIFDTSYLKKVIKLVKNRLIEIMVNETDFFEVKVFFKPKKYDDEQVVFRPLHTASLIDQIAMVAMLQILVFDVSDTGKLLPSELSRLLPSNFYGNRISYDGSQLFKPWQEQYQEYTSKANEMIYNFSKTCEYKYEVSLDLENFFPSINPQVLYNYVIMHLPLKLDHEDDNTVKAIIKKLLIFRLDELDETEAKWYHKSINDDMKRNKIRYAKGMPQGLPHTYFMANIYMLLIRDIYSEIFPGEMLFYVDDSVIFTNGKHEKIDNDLFSEAIADLNREIADKELNLLQQQTERDDALLPHDYCYQDNDFGVRVHKANTKSVFATIDDVNKQSGVMYLKGLSRETSNIGFDMFSTFSDDEVGMVRNRTTAILCAIQKEICRLKESSVPSKVYMDKLIRYKKFFAYRKTILDFQINGTIEELKKAIINDISLRNNQDKLPEFFEKYTDDILASTISFVFRRCVDENAATRDLIKAVVDLNKTLYGANCKHSYLLKAYEPYVKNKQVYKNTDIYSSLQRNITIKYHTLREQSTTRKYKEFCENVDKCMLEDYKKIYTLLNFSALFDYSEYVRKNSNNIERMILNALFSYFFEYEIEDSFMLAKKSHSPIQYSEVRILAILRNKTLSLSNFLEKYKEYMHEEYRQTADYSLFQVLDIFKTFVVHSDRIDSLILIHKYCCDTWKNGSKYLHFYTLHNQEHAVSLIRSSVQILHAISYLKLKQLDYFILFASCYLHDISMVTLPEISKFYTKHDEASTTIYTEFLADLEENNCNITKKALCEAYQKIDEFFEADIRSNHAYNSSIEIRKLSDLNFIDPALREIIAEITKGHGDESADIYYLRSAGKSSLVNEKFLKILLRLSDLLDMSRYRISRVILNHNITNLNRTSRFHWISHLITDGYNLNAEYRLVERNNRTEYDTFLKRGDIVEALELTVDVLMSQTTEVKNGKKCKFISESTFDRGVDGETIVKIACNKESTCTNPKCNFLCKWFTVKNNYLFDELSALKRYLNNVQDNFFSTEINVNIRVVASTDIPNDIFDYLHDYVNSCCY